MRAKKDRRAPPLDELPQIFGDRRIRELEVIAKLPPQADMLCFAAAIREAARIYVRDAGVASNNEVHHEVDGLLRAADRRNYEDVAKRREALSERTRILLSRRAIRPAVALTIPDSEAFRDPTKRDEACKIIASLCRIGAGWKEGRRRPSGKRSTTLASVLHAPHLEQHPPRREAELDFVMWLRLAYFDATGEPPALTANPQRPGPFARMVQACLNDVRSGANAVESINELQRRGKDKKDPPSLSGQNP